MVNYSNTSIVPIVYPITYKYRVPVIYATGAPGDFVASGSSLVLPRAATDTRGQYSTLLYAIQEAVQYYTVFYAGAAERGAGEEERRRDEGTGDGACEGRRSDCWC